MTEGPAPGRAGSSSGPLNPGITVVDGRVGDLGVTVPGSRLKPGITVRDTRGAALTVTGDADTAAVTGLPAGARLCPGFVDHHLHLLAMAAARCSIDVSGARSLTDVFDRLAAVGTGWGGSRVGVDGWLRAWGIDESDLAERRLPTVAELDALCPRRPLVLHHRTGHTRIMNTAALSQGGTAPPLAEEQLVRALRQLSTELCAAGVVAVTDATHTNNRTAVALLGRLLELARFVPRVTALVGADRLDGCRFGDRLGPVTVGHAKIMPPSCGLGSVAALVTDAHRRGFPVAVHVVDVDELQAALDAGVGAAPGVGVRQGDWRRPGQGDLDRRGKGNGSGDRLEHLGLCLPEQLEQLAGRRLTVVTQPTFVTRRAGKYRQDLSPVELGWLYPLHSLLRAGIEVRGSSDAPVVPIGPLEQIRAATTRTLGDDLGHPSQRLDVESAFKLVTGPLNVGDPADFVVLSQDPVVLGPARLGELQVLATVQGGVLVHGSLPFGPGD